MLISANILKEASHIDKRSVITTANENTSLFSFGLEVLSESNNTIREIMTSIYKDSGYNINESFKEKFKEKFSFSNIIKSIFKIFLNGLKEIFKQFKIMTLKIVYDSNQIEKYKNDIKKYNKDIDIRFDYFYYSYLDDDIPSINLFNDFSADYQSTLQDLEKIARNRTSQEIIEKINNMTNEASSGLKEFYNKIRSSIFGKYSNDIGVVTEQNYAGKLFAFFRSNTTEPYNHVTLKSNDYHDALDRFLNGKTLINNCEKNIQFVERNTTAIINRISRILPENFMTTYTPIDYNLEYALNNFLKLKCGNLQQICNIFTMAYSAKLEATKQALIQDKKVLFEVIIKLMSNKEED